MSTRLLVALSSALLSTACGGDVIVAIGQRIHHDDFEYSVQHVERKAQIGDRHARGGFLIVTFQVENRARAVDHHWNNDIAYVVDDEEHRYDNDEDAQKALDAANPFGYQTDHVTPAGAIETTKLVFDVPLVMNDPCLKVRGVLLMGDVFDGGQFRRTRVRLF